MKNPCNWLCLMLLIASCGKGDVKEHRDGQGGSGQSAVPATKPTPDSSQYLTIHGKDVWVRDSSYKGPVLMKLNEGDRCQILNRGGWARIKGEVNCWYKIRYKGREGWVFGSQSDQRLTTLGEGATPRLAWESFRSHFQIQHGLYDDEEQEDEETCVDTHRFDMIGDSAFKVGYGNCDMGVYDTTYTCKGDSIRNLRFFDGSTFFGAAFGCMDAYTSICVNLGDIWAFLKVQAGGLGDWIMLSDSSYLFIMDANRYCGFWVERSIDVYHWEPESLELSLVQNLFSGRCEIEHDNERSTFLGKHVEEIKMEADGKLPYISLKYAQQPKWEIWNWDPGKVEFVVSEP